MFRRHSARFGCVSAIAAAAVVCAIADSPKLARFERADEAMGSTFALVLYGEDRSGLEEAAAAAFAELHRLDEKLSNYQPASEWSAVNRDAAARPVQVSQELFALLSECMRYSRESDGTFDVTVGPLMKAWDFFKGEGRLPNPEQVRKALDRVGYRHVILDAAQLTVRFDRNGVELDPGGIGKGYAVDRMAAVLKQRGVGIALISGAGSSIYGLGAPPESPEGWPVTIRDPADPHRTSAEVRLRNQSLSTSGSYEKFFRANGRRYSHIMDPRTGFPAQGTASVSVVAPRTLDSEAWAKPYFIHGRAWTAAHRPPKFRVYFCEDKKHSACAWIP